MSPRGKEHYQSLRDLYRTAEYRRFRVRHRTNWYAEILGFGPDGRHMVGWREGSDDLRKFDPDQIEWTEPTIYL